jgi:hypothetical protein
MAGRVDLDDVDMAVLGDRAAMVAFAAGLDGRAALAVRADAVQRLGDDPRRRRLADAAHAGQHEGMGDAARGHRVGQRADQRVLADQPGKIARAIFAGENAIGGLFGRVGHQIPGRKG